jgi:hypothetical protein
MIVADANKQRSIPGSEWNKEIDAQAASRAAKEYLAILDDAAFGAASSVTPKFVSPSGAGSAAPTALFHCQPAGPASISSMTVADQASRSARPVKTDKTQCEHKEVCFHPNSGGKADKAEINCNTPPSTWDAGEALRTGGEYYGVGAGVGISGFRADLGLGDDFFGSREGAWSGTRANARLRQILIPGQSKVTAF